ncbi:MAG: IS66 family insertion sequence element accessory protein TnpB [Geobacteraceae bacterium]|nr:IS66 family insertion sequence element accessory protein TnpB [Geobacteraceae bacterium]
MHPSGVHRIFLYGRCIDMRKSFEGLSRLIEVSHPDKLLTGALFLFLNRRRNLIKILYWDGDGFVIWYKRLEQGTFSDCFSGQGELSRQQFTMLLEGIVPRRLNKRFSLS